MIRALISTLRNRAGIRGDRAPGHVVAFLKVRDVCRVARASRFRTRGRKLCVPFAGREAPERIVLHRYRDHSSRSRCAIKSATVSGAIRFRCAAAEVAAGVGGRSRRGSPQRRVVRHPAAPTGARPSAGCRGRDVQVHLGSLDVVQAEKPAGARWLDELPAPVLHHAVLMTSTVWR